MGFLRERLNPINTLTTALPGTASLLATAMEIYLDGISRMERAGEGFFKAEVQDEEGNRRADQLLKKLRVVANSLGSHTDEADREMWGRELNKGKSRPDMDEAVACLIWKQKGKRMRAS